MREDLKLPLAISEKFAKSDNDVMNLDANISWRDNEPELITAPVQQQVSEQAPKQPSYEESPIEVVTETSAILSEILQVFTGIFFFSILKTIDA